MLKELERESNLTLTENGAAAYRSTGSFCVDFFSVCAALRHANADTMHSLFVRAFAEDRTLALRTLFYARDIQGGLGERRVFLEILSRLAGSRPECVRKNLRLIPEYGRWDDLLALMDTPCERDAAACMRERLQKDLQALEGDGQVSLLAKWLPSVNTSSALRVKQARRLCGHFGMSEKEYRRTLCRLRTQIDVLEKRLCAKDYSFDYEKQPSGAMHKYRRAFQRNDPDRYSDYINQVLAGEKQMHADTLFPYQIVRSCIGEDILFRGEAELTDGDIRSLDAVWKSLPDYCGGHNALAMIDGSGSMYCAENPSPAEIAMSLGIYFAEHTRGYFRDHFLTFSHTPRLVRLQGDNIADRVRYCMSFNEIANTDLRAAFLLLLETAVENRLPVEDMPETVFVISDMEFDEGATGYDSLFLEIRDLYDRAGYPLPNLVYWNVNRRREQFPVLKDEHGTVLVSGASPSLFRMAISQNISPEDYMRSVLDSERYRPIQA